MLPRKDASWFAAVLLLLGACGNKEDPRPPLQPCNAGTCNPGTIVAGGAVGGSSNGGASSTSGIGFDVTVVGFTGSTKGANAWSPQGVQVLDGTFTLRASGVNGAAVTGTGSNPIPLANIVADGKGWVSVTPSTNLGFLPGLHAVPVDPGSNLSVPLLRVSDFDFVPTLLSAQPLSLDTSAAQVVVKFVDGVGAGVSGLRVSRLGADAVAYSSDGTWADEASGVPTDASGLIAGINIPAAADGSTLLIVTGTGLNLQGVAQSATATLPIQPGFVTYGTIDFE